MRIRKHAKISPLLYATPSPAPCALLRTHVCQLNQSPWDAMKFSPPPTPPPPPPYQGDGDGVSDDNGSSGRRGSAPEREEEDQQLEYNSDDDVDTETKVTAALCCKTDGKSWQCRREAAIDSSLCEHHISQSKSYSGLSHPAAKKPGKVAARRAHAKKASAAANASNPYEFYYYSGFGPRWGKKRGENSNDSSNNNGGGSMRKSAERKREDDVIERAVAASVNEMDSDENEEEWNSGNMGKKKRVRKPIKARSLKSLM